MTIFSNEFIYAHLDNVLRASGSALRHYTLSGTVSKMRQAMIEAMEQAAFLALEKERRDREGPTEPLPVPDGREPR